MLQLSCKFGESKWNPFWFIVLTSSFGSNYVLNEHEDFNRYDPYGPYALPSEMLPCYNYPASLLNQDEFLTDLSSQQAHPALIMTHLQYRPR